MHACMHKWTINFKCVLFDLFLLCFCFMFCLHSLNADKSLCQNVLLNVCKTSACISAWYSALRRQAPTAAGLCQQSYVAATLDSIAHLLHSVFDVRCQHILSHRAWHREATTCDGSARTYWNEWWVKISLWYIFVEYRKFGID